MSLALMDFSLYKKASIALLPLTGFQTLSGVKSYCANLCKIKGEEFYTE